MHPKSLGISSPAGRDPYEIYLKVKSRPSILGKVSDVMKQRNIDILSANAHVSDDKQTAYIMLFVEMADSTAGIDEVVKTLREQDYVIEAVSESRKDMYYEGVMFPLTSGGHYRVFTLGATGWVALNKALLQTYGSGGEAILFNEGRSVGADTASRIAENRRFGGRTLTRELLLANFIGLFRASGHGMLDVARDEEGFAIKINRSVLSEYDKPMIDHFLVGVVTGAVESIYRSPSGGLTVRGLRLNDRVVEFRLVSDEEGDEGVPAVSI